MMYVVEEAIPPRRSILSTAALNDDSKLYGNVNYFPPRLKS
jgi:hypothetical protein